MSAGDPIRMAFPDWMNAPIRPIQVAKLDDLQAKTAEQRDWLEKARAEATARERDARAEAKYRAFAEARDLVREREQKQQDYVNPLFADAISALPEPLPSNLQKYIGAQAARIAFGEPAPAPKPKKPAGLPILPLDTPRRFFED